MDYKLKTLALAAAMVAHAQAFAQQKPLPPNTVKIAENLYADQTEMSNLDWKEYVFWHKHVFGEGSTEHLAALPDTTVWKQMGSYSQPLIERYYSHQAYEKYPVVGISQQQAAYFCRWRSNRYFEMLLVKEGLIEFNKNQTAENYFAIERFLAGEFELKKEKSSVSHYPIFQLPNEAQHKQMQAHNANVAATQKKTKPVAEAAASAITPTNVWPDKKHQTKNYLYFLNENVAEWGDEPHLIYPGSFQKIPSENVAADQSSVPTSSAYIGFRCICQWVPIQ